MRKRILRPHPQKIAGSISALWCSLQPGQPFPRRGLVAADFRQSTVSECASQGQESLW